MPVQNHIASSRAVIATLTTAALLAGCSVREGRIAISPALATSSERMELTHMGGGQEGQLRLGDMSGRFTRGVERLGIFPKLLAFSRGGGGFRITSSGGVVDLAGRCSYREKVVTAGPIMVTPERLTFSCDFARAGTPIDAWLIITDPKKAYGTLHGRAERTGTLFFEGREYEVRSIHEDEQGGLKSPTPLGYEFSFDGRQVGAVDLNGLNKTLFVPRSAADREAVIAASLALSTFWDPAALD